MGTAHDTRPADLGDRTRAALTRNTRAGELGIHLPSDEVDEIRVVGNYLAAHPDAPQLVLDPPPSADALADFARAAGVADSAERQLDDRAGDPCVADADRGAGWRLAAHERERDRPNARRDRRARDVTDDAALTFDLVP